MNPDTEHGAAATPRPFPRFWLSRVLSTLSFQMLSVALGWQVYSLTNSALALGLVGLAQFAPMLALTLVVGHVADHYDRRTIIGLCQFGEVLIAAALAAFSLGGSTGVGPIYALAALLGAARAFEAPTMQALLPTLVTRSEFPRMSALSSAASQTAQIAGPALGGFLYAAGPAIVYATTAAALAVAAAAMLSIRGAGRTGRPMAGAALFSGLSYMVANRLILGVTTLDLFAVLLGGATALLPVFARDILGAGAFGLGLLRAAPAIGALGVSFVVSRRNLPQPVGPILFGALMIFGAATVTFGVSRSLPLSLAALVVLGAADSLSVAIRSSVVQLQTPDAMRGRVSAVNSLFVGTSNQLGEFESGVAAAAIGTVPAVVAGGVATLVVALLWMRLFPTLRRLSSLADAVDPDQAARTDTDRLPITRA